MSSPERTHTHTDSEQDADSVVSRPTSVVARAPPTPNRSLPPSLTVTENTSSFRCPAFYSSKTGIAIFLGIFLIIVGAIWGFVPLPGHLDIPRPGGIGVMLLGVLLITTVTTPKLYFADHPKPGHSFNYVRSPSASIASGINRLPTTPSRPRRSFFAPTTGATLTPSTVGSPTLRSRSPSPRRSLTPTVSAPPQLQHSSWVPHSPHPPSYEQVGRAPSYDKVCGV